MYYDSTFVLGRGRGDLRHLNEERDYVRVGTRVEPRLPAREWVLTRGFLAVIDLDFGVTPRPRLDVSEFDKESRNLGVFLYFAIGSSLS